MCNEHSLTQLTRHAHRRQNTAANTQSKRRPESPARSGSGRERSRTAARGQPPPHSAAPLRTHPARRGAGAAAGSPATSRLLPSSRAFSRRRHDALWQPCSGRAEFRGQRPLPPPPGPAQRGGTEGCLYVALRAGASRPREGRAATGGRRAAPGGRHLRSCPRGGAAPAKAARGSPRPGRAPPERQAAARPRRWHWRRRHYERARPARRPPGPRLLWGLRSERNGIRRRERRAQLQRAPPRADFSLLPSWVLAIFAILSSANNAETELPRPHHFRSEGGGGRGGETAVRRRSCGPRRGLPSTGALRKRSAGGEKRHSVGRAALQAEFGATPSFWLTYLPANRNAAWKPKWPIVVRRGWGVGMRVRAWALRAVGRLLQDGAGRWLSVARPEGGWAAPRRYLPSYLGFVRQPCGREVAAEHNKTCTRTQMLAVAIERRNST